MKEWSKEIIIDSKNNIFRVDGKDIGYKVSTLIIIFDANEDKCVVLEDIPYNIKLDCGGTDEN